MKTIEDFKNIYKNKFVLCCGLGYSLKLFYDDCIKYNIDLSNIIIISVYDIGRLFTPNYLLFADSIDQSLKDKFDVEQNRIQWLLKSNAKHIFLHNYNDNRKYFPEDKQDRLINKEWSDYILNVNEYDEDKLYYCRTSVFMAVTLAIYMGCNRIGIIGLDFDGSYFWGAKSQQKQKQFDLVLDNLNKGFEKLQLLRQDIRIYNFAGVNSKINNCGVYNVDFVLFKMIYDDIINYNIYKDIINPVLEIKC